MAKNTSILLGEYFENYNNQKISLSKYLSVSEAIRTAIRQLENEETRQQSLSKEIEIGEKSGFIKNVDRNENPKNLDAKYLKK